LRVVDVDGMCLVSRHPAKAAPVSTQVE